MRIVVISKKGYFQVDLYSVLIAAVGPKQVDARLAQILAAHGPNPLVLTRRFKNEVEAVTEFIRETYPNVAYSNY
ncbi:predicted protein [Sclerotinia sclerotiorum 1980 UF-70]|uniref:Uncharacterized protein n=1 Tax=Sclerotinia sclerotiorum (strain ATCC 18683 / 1980 / Ss-1) TaxID=665079 RepID=A7ERJ4_SCLS1|nr:predicted protein [Sclerotinia sclerotiorum 1980 UF-70]EDN92086.1 predicted protein [Sclerotinia sclerotiorum 1980 UF-70]